MSLKLLNSLFINHITILQCIITSTFASITRSVFLPLCCFGHKNISDFICYPLYLFILSKVKKIGNDKRITIGELKINLSF
jgi:hypothetical protein